MFSKKATKIDEIFIVLLHNVKSIVKILSIFVAFLENMNFTPLHWISNSKMIFKPTYSILDGRQYYFLDNVLGVVLIRSRKVALFVFILLSGIRGHPSDPKRTLIVLHPKCSNQWPHLLAAAMDCGCSKMLNCSLNKELFLSLARFLGESRF